MYSGAILYFLGIALLSGSWYAVAIAVALIALFGLRAVWEEQTLIDGLPGYAAYAERVRYRLIPGLWWRDANAPYQEGHCAYCATGEVSIGHGPRFPAHIPVTRWHQ